MTRSSLTTKKRTLALTALIMLLVPQLFCFAAWSQSAPVVANPPTAPSNSGTVAPGASTVQSTDPNSPYPDPAVNTIQETAETNTDNVVTTVNNMLLNAIAQRQSGRNTETYNGMKAWFGDDMISNIFQNIGQLIGRWFSEFIDSWISSTVQFLAAFLRTFVLNPNIAVNGVQNTPGGGGQTDDISPYVREAAGTMYGIAIDLLLLLFILCIWKFWAEAAWRGGGHLFGSVGRLIFTAGLMLAWPTIYAFEIQITNEMIKAIYFSGGDQITQLDVALTAAVKAGLVGTTGLLANAFAPVIGGAVAGSVGGAVGGIVAFAGLIIYLILGVVLITQIVYILVLKAIQTGLLTAQYMFAPIFIVFFATPDTENVCAGFVKSFVECSLWTFVWVGLLKIMVIILYSQFNPWGKITMAVGILQIMIQVPTFLARAQISPMSDFISAGLITGGLMKGASALANKAAGAMTQFAKYTTGDMYGARGMPTSKKVGMENTPTGAANPELMNNLKNAGQGVGATPPNGKGGAAGAAAAAAAGAGLANPLTKKPAAGTPGANGLQNQAANAGLGPDGKPLNTPGLKKESKSAQVAKALTPAAIAALAAGGAGAAMAANGAAQTGEAGKDVDSDEEKRRKLAEQASAAVPVPPRAAAKGAQANQPQSEAEKAAAIAAATAAGLAGLSDVPKPGAKDDKKKTGAAATPVKGREPVTPASPVGAGDKKTQQETVRQAATGNADDPQGVQTNVTTDPSKAPTPPKAKGANDVVDKDKDNKEKDAAPGVMGLPEVPTKIGAVATSARNRINGGAANNGRNVVTPPIAGENAGKDGKLADNVARVPVMPGAEDASAVNTTLTPEQQKANALKPPTSTATLAPGLNVEGVPGVGIGIPDVPVRLPGSTALNSKSQKGAGGRAVETANSGPNINNGRNVDPFTARNAVSVPAGAVDEDNPIAAARAGLVGHTGGNNGGGPGGPRQLAMPAGGGGGGNGGGGGGGNPNDVAHINYNPPPNGPTRGGRPITMDGATMFDQSNYRWVPGRNLLTDIRTAQGPQQGDAADGQSAISLGAKGIASVRYGQGATSEQKALMLMTAGYAGVFSQDPVAFDAARQSAIDAGGDAPKGFAQRIAANWLQYSGGSFKSTAIAKNQFQQTLMEQATTGAEAYVNGQSGNAYTGYLRGRYGAMTADQQAWGVHITSDPTSPESGWSTTVAPATGILVNAGMPITAENRAAASHAGVMRQAPALRGQAVRGFAAYLGAMADEQLGPNAHPLERDAFMGRVYSQIPSETVEACAAIMTQTPNGGGAALCARPDYVNSVSNLMTNPDATRKLDANTAYRNFAGVMRGGGGGAVGTQTIDVLSAGGGGGYGGGFVGGGGPVPPPPMAGGGFNNVIDAQYRDLGGTQQGNFGVANATVYAPSNPAFGSTTVRGGPPNLGVSNQTVHANIDVLPTGSSGNFNLPPNLGPQAGIIQRTEVNLNAALVGDDNDVHNVDMNVTGVAGRQEVNIVGGGSSNAVSNTEMNVHAEVIAPNGPVNLPPVGQFASMQNVEQRTTANVSMGGGSSGGGGGTYVQQGLAQVYLNPTSNAGQQSAYLNNQVAAMGAQAAHGYTSNYQSAQQIVIEMMRAGFDDNAIQNPQIASVAMQTYQQDPSMLGSAAIASKIMQPQEMSTGTVQVVQQMVDAGWSPKNITRPDVLTSQMIISSGAFGGAPGYGYPDPRHVQQVRQHPNFVPEYTRGAAARGAINQIPAEYF